MPCMRECENCDKCMEDEDADCDKPCGGKCMMCGCHHACEACKQDEDEDACEMCAECPEKPEKEGKKGLSKNPTQTPP